MILFARECVPPRYPIAPIPPSPCTADDESHSRRILDNIALLFLGFRRKARRPDPTSAPTRATVRAAMVTLPSSLRTLSRLPITRVSLAIGSRGSLGNGCAWIRIREAWLLSSSPMNPGTRGIYCTLSKILGTIFIIRYYFKTVLNNVLRR